MSFSEEWDRRYAENTHMSIWPWSDVVSLVRRQFAHFSDLRVLELGCGAGANIPFFLSLGARYCAIEGSSTIVNQLHKRFPELADSIVVGDFTREQLFEGSFDLILDRASLTHNDAAGIESGLRLAWDALKRNGLFIGVDWFSTRGDEFGRGSRDIDPYTRRDYVSGPFCNTGKVHFSDESHLRALFSRFRILVLEEKVIERVIPAAQGRFASWNIVAQRQNA